MLTDQELWSMRQQTTKKTMYSACNTKQGNFCRTWELLQILDNKPKPWSYKMLFETFAAIALRNLSPLSKKVTFKSCTCCTESFLLLQYCFVLILTPIFGWVISVIIATKLTTFPQSTLLQVTEILSYNVQNIAVKTFAFRSYFHLGFEHF